MVKGTGALVDGAGSGGKIGKKTRGAGMGEAGSGGRRYGGRWLRERGSETPCPPPN